ncbi:hypothetical protein G9A89_021953 [Geosiphon pyriformis]|nr:hypothetical protein G9A89_021953 [Geosiphon pyriformis]
MAIELVQKIEDNQKMHLESALPVFAFASAMAPASQIAATSFTVQIQDFNKQLIDRLTANFARLLELLAQAKKAKVDFVLDSNKVSTSTANNNKPPNAKVFKNPPKLKPPEIVQKSGLYFVIKDFMKTLVHITFVQVAGYFIDLILDSKSSISVIAKHFLEAIGRKIDELSTKLITNVHDNKKKGLDIVKAVPVHINSISIETDMEISKAKEYIIIVGNEWFKKAKALLDYEFCELTIRCGEKLIVVKCHH